MSARRSDALLKPLELFGMRFGLERTRRVLGELGDPHLAVPVVLVGGTNGKGSAATLLAAMCRAAGYRTGLYTSPHLESVTERLSLGGRSISDRQLAGYLENILATARALDGEATTSFESLTLAAFSFFRDAHADLAILEVGLGGRLDATNVSEPVLSLITSISHDHEKYLGSSIESIAHEKCGILRRAKPAVAWADSAEIAAALRTEAEAVEAKLVFADGVALSSLTEPELSPQRVRLRSTRQEYELEIHLAGRHQLHNLSVSLLAAETLGSADFPALNARAIATGTASCRWPGRLEWIDLGNGRRILLDAAHNIAGINALVNYMSHLTEPPDLLFGALAEKSIDAVVPRLAAASRRVTLTKPPGDRAAELQRWQPLFGNKVVHAEADLERAFDLALARCERTLLVCGSIYLVGKIRKLLRQRYGVPEPLVS